jgi:hypothetical protein
MDDRPDFRWLVDRRSQVQLALVELHGLIARPEQQVQLLSDLDATRAHGLLMGAGFSLWRAAFLSHGSRDRADVLRHAESFLSTLLADNAINYPQDRDTKNWSSGYYLNNARFRLVKAYSVLHVDGTGPFQELADLDRRGIEAFDSKRSWDILSAALSELCGRLVDRSRTAAGAG